MAHDVRLLARHPDLLAERHNYTATTDPTVNDDENDYYGVGSVWVNRLTNTVFICCDPTNGAAVWEIITGPHEINTTAEYDDADGEVTIATMAAETWLWNIGTYPTTPYDAGTVSLGTDANNELLLTTEDVDAQGNSSSVLGPYYFAVETVIKAFITPGAATQGTIRIKGLYSR